MLAITKNELSFIASTRINTNAIQWALENIEYLNKPMTFFGSSVKVENGSEKFDTYVMYLQPADKVALKTICDAAVMSGCKKDCLISSGQLGMSVAQNAATKRTILMLLRPDYFEERILFEVDRAERKAKKTGIPCLFRLNGTSDLDFSAIISQRPQSQWYDYTKILSRVRKNRLRNYDLTFSGSMYSVQSRAALGKAIARKHRVAVAFNTKLIASDGITGIPSMFSNFDKTDLRHLDGPVIGALTRKGSNKKQRALDNKVSDSFFITNFNLGGFWNLWMANK